MSCSDLDSGSGSGIVYVLRLLFPPPYTANEIHSASLSLSLSVSLSLSLSLFYVSLFAFIMVSLSYVQTQLCTQHSWAPVRRPRRDPAVTDKLKTGAQTWRFILINAITCTQTFGYNVLYLHKHLTCDFLIKSDQIHLPLRKAVRMFPCVWAEIRTFKWLSLITGTKQQITQQTPVSHVPVQISHVLIFSQCTHSVQLTDIQGMMVSE